MTETATVQSYILPTPVGWAVMVYGDPILPDGDIVPLPMTLEMPYETVETIFSQTTLGHQSVIIDGWDTVECMRELEPDLAEEVWGPA
jgi:hypothetical protein